MAKLEKSPDFGVLQDFVDSLFADAEEQTRLDIVVQAESLDLNPDLLEIVSLLPPGTYDRIKLCDQFNSSLSSHGWGYYYGAVHEGRLFFWCEGACEGSGNSTHL